jgi:iron complex outermembrane receptor protein
MTRSWAALGFRTFCFLTLVAGAGAPQLLFAADGPTTADASADANNSLETVQITADKLHVLPTQPNESVFGFGKNIIETPRSLTSISSEMLDRVNITDINDLVALTPGSFTQSFFGVAGSLDIRGTAGENYFRGVRRIENPGNYPQAIAASDRIDVVRGPASPIFGPSKVGGYLNFEPKSARAESGSYMKESKGEIGFTAGSWNEKTLHAEVGGPATTFGKPSGYYVYSEFENSGSYYQNTSTKQAIFQASYNIDFSDHFRTEAGGMYQDFNGNQVAGWNRLTQALIDHGTYVTGSPPNVDTNGDGLLSLGEANAAKLGTGDNFIPPFSTPAQIQAALSNPNLHLLNPGTTHISGSQVLVAPTDKLTDGVTTLYFDMIYEPVEGTKLVNKSFYEQLNNLNENAYGFSQVAHTWAFEDHLTLTYGTTFGENVKANFQVGPQIRHQDFDTGDDFFGEFFDRRDITKPSSSIDARTMATRGQDPYSDHAKGSYTDSSVAYLMDVTFFDKLNFLGGGRYDYIHISSYSRPDALTDTGLQARDSTSKGSWSASLSYQLPLGLRPYVTIARQATLTTGEGGQVEPFLVRDRTYVAPSKLNEYGVKGSFLDGHLYAAFDYFDQQRVDFNAQD